MFIKKFFITVVIFILTWFLWKVRHPAFFVPILLLTLIIPNFRKPSLIGIQSIFSFFLYPAIITYFLFSSILILFPSINQHLILAIGGLINFSLVVSMYFYLESDYRKAFLEGDKSVEKEYGDFLEKIRISVDIVRYFCGALITLFLINARLVSESDIINALKFINMTPFQLGVTSSEVVKFLPFLIYFLFLPSGLAAAGLKILADYSKLKKRPVKFLES